MNCGTHIQPILSMIDIIRSDMKDSNHKELLDTILRNAKRLQRLTDNILDVSKIERGSLDSTARMLQPQGCNNK